MKNFFDSKTGVVIAVNRKAMFSFFVLNPRFVPTQLPAEIWITRDPYQRALSCFWDKCRQNVKEPIQDCQRSIMLAANIIDIDRLKKITFHDFVTLLPSIKLSDEHFWLQTEQINVTGWARKIKMESDLPELGRCIQCDFSRKENETPRGGPDWACLDDKSKKAIHSVYARDFAVLGYDP